MTRLVILLAVISFLAILILQCPGRESPEAAARDGISPSGIPTRPEQIWSPFGSVDLDREVQEQGLDPDLAPNFTIEVAGYASQFDGSPPGPIQLLWTVTSSTSDGIREYLVTLDEEGSYGLELDPRPAGTTAELSVHATTPHTYVLPVERTLIFGLDERVVIDLLCTTAYCTIEGRILWDTGEPVVGGLVESPDGAEFITGPDGAFRLDSPVQGRLVMLRFGSGAGPGTRREELQLALTVGQLGAGLVSGVSLFLKSDRDRVLVRAFDRDGEAPMEGAEVLALGYELSAATDRLGLAVLQLPHGEATVLVVSKEGYATHTLRREPDMDELRVALRPAREITGRVIDGDGHGVAGARVEASRTLSQRSRFATTMSGEDGRFRIERDGGDGLVYLSATAPDGRRGSGACLLQGDRDLQGMLVRVSEKGTIKGTVVDDRDGSPVAGVYLSAVRVDTGDALVSSAETDSNGWFSISVSADARYELAANKHGYARAVLRIATGESTTIRLERVGFVAGRVIDRFGEPVELFTVELASEEEASGRLVSKGRRWTLAAESSFSIEAPDFRVGEECWVVVRHPVLGSAKTLATVGREGEVVLVTLQLQE